MPPPGALKRSSWEKRAAGLYCDAAAEHVYTTSFVWQYLWGRGKHDPSRHLSPDRRTRKGRRKISIMLLNTLMCGEIGRISRVGSFVELEVLSTKMMSSFDSCQVLLSPNFTYELSLEIQKYRLQCGRIYEIMGKFWVDVAYGVWGAAAFLGICVLKL